VSGRPHTFIHKEAFVSISLVGDLYNVLDQVVSHKLY